MQNENQPNLGFTLKFGKNNNGKTDTSLEFGITNSNPNAPYNPNNLELYDSKNKLHQNSNSNTIVCYVNCDGFMNSNKTFSAQVTMNSNPILSNMESTPNNNMEQSFTYQDSNIVAKEIINNDNTSTLVIESKTNLLEYQGNTTDTLMAGLSAMFASMAELAKQLDSYVKDNVRKFGAKGQIAYWIFQAQGASVSLAYNYGNNGNDLLKAGVSVGIEFVAGWVAGAIAATLIPTSAPVLVFVGVSALAALGIGLFLNTRAGKSLVNSLADDIIKPLIDSLQSKLQSFFSLFDSNPSNYELVSNPSLESNDYKSLIELLLDSNSTAKDIDSLLHSFPHYLKKESKQEVYTPLSPQGISFPYSSITYLTSIKALKDTLKEYLPKAKKIVLYTPNPFVSLYTSSPSYVFNSNLSFFNPHLQYLLTSKDTQQWLYDTLFNLARDNREIIVYEWGGSIEKLDSKESQANKKDLDSKDTNQSTNTQKQTNLKDLDSNFDSALRVA